ncbi:hypothetical protein GJ699_06100 [Duganella sp. FT80W]|uniref:Uncharacterized protein n=1 Tax=Duganella guangzhouensis TaxID=2666084 RepID=A0A6I2KV20_9BURK|nr:hypothetical protein [Duganella guangzhouensis]MRW89551.1 hypothetical protein [Duganella guangzhouensis]
MNLVPTSKIHLGKIFHTISVASLLVSLTGCGVFYSETRDKQGLAAKAAWEKVDLTTQISLARKNHTALLTDQLKATDELAVAQATLAARQLAIDGEGTIRTTLLAPLDSELKKLITKEAEAPTWLDYLSKQQKANNGVAFQVQEFRQLGLNPAGCDEALKNLVVIADIRKVDTAKADRLTEVQKEYTRECAGLTQLDPEPTLSKGLLADAIAARNSAKTRVKAASTETKLVREDFQAALKAYNDAVSKQAADAKGLGEKLTAATDRLKSAIEEADKDGKQLNSALGVKLLSDAEQTSVDRFLASFVEDDGKTKVDKSHQVEVLLKLSKFAGETKAEWTNAEKPNLVPLLLAKNLAQAKSDAAAREIKIRNLELALREQRVLALTKRYKQLLYAKACLVGQPAEMHNGEVIRAATSPVPLDESVITAFAPVSTRPTKPGEVKIWTKQVENKQRTWDAATNYLDDIVRLQPESTKPVYQIDALAHERSLSLAESNLALWTGVINSVIEQSATSAASGIKPTDIQSLLNSATLVWIGKGVN